MVRSIGLQEEGSRAFISFLPVYLTRVEQKRVLAVLLLFATRLRVL